MPTIKRRNPEEPVVERRRDRVAEEAPVEEDVVANDVDVDEVAEPESPVRHSSNQEREYEPEPDEEAVEELPEGVRTGWDGAEEVIKSGPVRASGGGIDWLKIKDHVELVKFLDDAPLTSYSQHWLSPPGGGANRPYLCPGSKCPLCGQGHKASTYHVFNVLHLSDGEPSVMAFQISPTTLKNLKEVFEDRKTGIPIIDKEFASVRATGKDYGRRTTFLKVKERDLVEEWDEIFEHFKFEELDSLIEDAKAAVYTKEQVSPKATSRRDLEKLAKYLDENPPEED